MNDLAKREYYFDSTLGKTIEHFLELGELLREYPGLSDFTAVRLDENDILYMCKRCGGTAEPHILQITVLERFVQPSVRFQDQLRYTGLSVVRIVQYCPDCHRLPDPPPRLIREINLDGALRIVKRHQKALPAPTCMLTNTSK